MDTSRAGHPAVRERVAPLPQPKVSSQRRLDNLRPDNNGAEKMNSLPLLFHSHYRRCIFVVVTKAAFFPGFRDGLMTSRMRQLGKVGVVLGPRGK